MNKQIASIAITTILCAVLFGFAGYVLGIQSYNETGKSTLTIARLQPLQEQKKSALNPIVYDEKNIVTLKSVDGAFSIDLPYGVKMGSTKEQKKDDGNVYGSVSFIFAETDNPDQSRELIISYAKPMIDGKGGMCVGENGEGTYKNEVIAKQKVQVCDLENSFRAEYFKHPTQKIEYSVATRNLNKKELEIAKGAIRKTFTFTK